MIRLLSPLNSHQIAALNSEFSPLIQQGEIYSTAPFPEEDDHLDLPRIAFEHNRRKFGLFRALIDRVNAY